MAKQIFDTDIIIHSGKEITVNTYMDDHLEITEEFTRKGFKFVVSREGHILTMHANGKQPRKMTEAERNLSLMCKERCIRQATSKDLVTYRFNGNTFKVSDKEVCCNTATEQMSLIDVADWMIAQF